MEPKTPQNLDELVARKATIPLLTFGWTHSTKLDTNQRGQLKTEFTFNIVTHVIPEILADQGITA